MQPGYRIGDRVTITDYQEGDFNLNGYTGVVVDVKRIEEGMKILGDSNGVPFEYVYEVWIQDSISPDWLYEYRFEMLEEVGADTKDRLCKNCMYYRNDTATFGEKRFVCHNIDDNYTQYHGGFFMPPPIYGCNEFFKKKEQ